MTEKHNLALAIFDAEDLAIISAHVQDAAVRVGDMAWLPEQRRFAILADRFDHGAALGGRCERVRCGLHFNRVRDVRQTGVPQLTPDVVLELLAIAFTQSNAPSGFITLAFAGDAMIRLDVECIEGAMRDLGHRKPCKPAPAHHGADEAGHHREKDA
ncbi:MAG: DUF2948 family protein [Hyphomicrobiales bacterium]|nr:DUF2948 family protein [Hyphomicrobiales bacterium]